MRRKEQKIVFVTGKGGVGKSAVAAALALVEARRGKKVLLVELGQTSFYRHVFPGAGQLKPTLVTNGLEVVRLEAESCLHEYMLHYLKVERLVNLLFANRATRSLINAAPALRELALLGKITSGPRGIGPDMPYDVVFVDAFSTGHFRALFMAPLGLAEAVRIGPMGEHCRMIVEILKNKVNSKNVLVTLPEELPVNEAGELCTFLRQQFDQEPTVVINRNLALPLSAEELQAARSKLRALASPPAWGEEFCDYLSEQGRRQEEAAAQVHRWKTKTIELPLYFINQWPILLRKMSEDLEQKWPTG